MVVSYSAEPLAPAKPSPIKALAAGVRLQPVALDC